MDAIAAAVLDLAEKHLGNFRLRNGQVKVDFCPFCKGGQNGDYDTFAIGLHNGAWNCLRGKCTKKKGSFKELAEFFGEDASGVRSMSSPTAMVKKVYVKPNPDDLHEITDEIVTFFSSRRISEQTIKDYKIASDKDGNIVFPFYDDKDVLTYVKYRKPKKHTKEDGPKEWQMANTKPILFGMNMVSFNKPLIITEGEIDCLSLYEAGCTNAVSVPSGCNNLDWINNCWEWLENFNQIIIFGDNDEPGMDMVSTVMKRLGEDRCMVPKEYPELIYNGKDYNRACKDANEILYAYGAEVLKELVDGCEPAPIKGVLNLASVPFIDPASVPRIMTKIPKLDHMIGGLEEGGVSVFSGKRGEGKSTLAGPLMLQAIQQGHSVCAYSGELPAYKFLEWIMLQATESKYISYKTDTRSGKNLCYVAPVIQQRIKNWLDGKFFLYDNSIIQEQSQTESILKVFEACARRYGCKLFLVDNLMSALVSADEENKAQAKFTAQLKAFASKYKAHVILVAHPRKEKADSVFSNDSVSGSSAITNLADVVINVEKNPKGIRVTKNRSFGITGFINTCYDPANRRIFQATTGDRVVYSWDHTDIPLPENPACTLEEFKIQDGREEDKSPF